MKNWSYGLFIGLFLALCLTLSVGMVFAGPAQPSANEQLAQPPSATTPEGEPNGAYLSDAAAWINDRFFPRNALISADRVLNAQLLGVSGQDSVILGSGGWLYFQPTLNDYTGVDGLTDRQLRQAAGNLALMAEYCRENGKQFLFVIAPNKNALYDAHMPNYGVKAEKTDAQKLYELLTELRVPYGDLFSAFEGQNEVLYFAHDSHWNSKGAALGADVINAGFGRESSYFQGDFSASIPHEGDLYAMVYPGRADPEQDPVYGGQLCYEFTGRATRPDAISLQTAGQGSGTLLAYRDSFGNLLFPYLADSFAQATFSRSASYDLTKEADFVLVELVQRNLNYLLSYVPTMPSPQRQITLPGEISGTLSARSAGKGPLMEVTGTLPGEADGAWVICDGNAYEAFLLLDQGFAVNLPPEGEIQSVVYTIGGETRMYDLSIGGN